MLIEKGGCLRVPPSQAVTAGRPGMHGLHPAFPLPMTPMQDALHLKLIRHNASASDQNHDILFSKLHSQPTPVPPTCMCTVPQVKPSDPPDITPEDLSASGMSGIFFSMLSDVKQFFDYNYREVGAVQAVQGICSTVRERERVDEDARRAGSMARTECDAETETGQWPGHHSHTSYDRII